MAISITNNTTLSKDIFFSKTVYSIALFIFLGITFTNVITGLDAFGSDISLSDQVWQVIRESLLGSIVVALLAAFLVVRYMVRPIKELMYGLDDVQKSDVGKLNISAYGDELQPLVISLNGLIDGQQLANTNLQDQEMRMQEQAEELANQKRAVQMKQLQLERQRNHDLLTNLPSRDCFDDVVREWVAEAKKDQSAITLCLMGLDNLKLFNDRFGQASGDSLLIEMGRRLNLHIGKNNFLARMGGDEYAILFRGVQGVGEINEIAKGIMDVVSAPYSHQEVESVCTGSLGVSIYTTDAFSADQLVSNAAIALQHAKQSGSNQWRIFNEWMRNSITERHELAEAMHKALEEGQFEVHFQPKVSIQDLSIIGAEALIRWIHPEKGFVPPDKFIPIAEETGFVVPLGDWVLRHTCQCIKRWQKMGLPDMQIAVNLSAIQVQDRNLFDSVCNVLESESVAPRNIELEITESAVMEDPKDMIKLLERFSQYGIHMAIDDFGTGYSSLSYLKQFPVHTLKIDKAFVDDISEDSSNAAIVNAVLGLGHHFNMKVVAEGIETPDQMETLRAAGCDIAQGYLISRPLRSDAFEAWANEWPEAQKNLEQPAIH